MFSKRGDKRRGKKDKKSKDGSEATPPEQPSPTPVPANTEAPREAEERRRKEEETRQAEEAAAAKRKEEEAAAAAAAAEKAKRKTRKKRPKASSSPSSAGSSDKAQSGAVTTGTEIDTAATEAELRELEAVSSGGSSSQDEYKPVFPESVYEAYHQLQSFARELNVTQAYPEIIFVGQTGHGKSSVLEALLGARWSAVGSGATQRPIFVQLANNPRHTGEPSITLKRDLVLKSYRKDVRLSIAELGPALAQRQDASAADTPIYVTWESATVLNMTLIDTPGLGQAEMLDKIVVDLAHAPGRHIVCVQKADQVGRNDILNYLKEVDPDLSRTLFVYTHLAEHLRPFTSAQDLNKFLSRTFDDTTNFFITTPSAGVRKSATSEQAYQERVWQCSRRDADALEALRYDKRHEGSIGVFRFRSHLLNEVWRDFQNAVPSTLRQFRDKTRTTAAALATVQGQLDALDSSKLRSLSNTYVVEFLQVVSDLIAGTAEGIPTVNGQTLDEERAEHGDAVWRDAHNSPIDFSAQELHVPYHDARLYGGQQFERLLAEFAAIAARTDISEPSMDDIATASGINKRSQGPNHAWAAADLAQQKAREAFVPLIKQVSSRASYVMKRLTDISRRIMESRRRAASEWNPDANFDVDNMEHYRFFLHHVKELYDAFVERQAQVVAAKCLDEFYSTRTIYWYVTEDESKDLVGDRKTEEDTKRAVVELSRKVFGELRDRILKNVLLKFYNFFLVPLQNDLWNVVQSSVSSLTDTELEEKFESKATQDKLTADATRLTEQLADLRAKEKEFLASASDFAHPSTL